MVSRTQDDSRADEAMLRLSRATVFAVEELIVEPVGILHELIDLGHSDRERCLLRVAQIVAVRVFCSVDLLLDVCAHLREISAPCGGHGRIEAVSRFGVNGEAAVNPAHNGSAAIRMTGASRRIARRAERRLWL